MHWEKIPLEGRTLHLHAEDGRYEYEKVNLWKEQLEDLMRKDVPVHMLRTRHKDGRESISIEKQVQD
jgi:hypothetical protein